MSDGEKKDPFEGFVNDDGLWDPSAESAKKPKVKTPADEGAPDEDDAEEPTDEERVEDTADDEENTSEEDGDEGDAAESEDDAEEKPKSKKQKKKSVEQRIRELTWQRREQEREAQAAKSELDSVRAELDTLKKEINGDLTNAPAQSKSGLKKPDPNDPKYQYGQFDPQYETDRDAYLDKLVEERIKSATEQTRQAEAAAQKEQEYQKRTADMQRKGVEMFEDFEQSLARIEKMPSLDPQVAEELLASEYAAQIIDHAAKNPEEIFELSEKSQREQLKYLGKLEARFETNASGKNKTKTKITGAAPPPPRARGSDKASATKNDEDFASLWARKGGDAKRK